MIGIHRLPMSPEQIEKLPLGLRTLFYKEIEHFRREKRLYRIEKHGSNYVATMGGEKPISRVAP